MLVDTHAHIYLDDFKQDIEQVIERSLEHQVNKIALPNIDVASLNEVFHLADRFPAICYPMLGLHPCSVKEDFELQLDLLYKRINERPLCAIGEIGLDFYWDTTFLRQQEEALVTQIEWAIERNLPIVIHSRDSTDRNIEIIQKYKGRVRGVFHCFTGTQEQAIQIIDMNFYLGLGGVLTFKNSGLDKIARKIPMSSIVLETDSPYLTPTPFRGKRNESGYVHHVAQHLANIKSCSLEEIARQTTKNALDLYPLLQLST